MIGTIRKMITIATQKAMIDKTIVLGEIRAIPTIPVVEVVDHMAIPVARTVEAMVVVEVDLTVVAMVVTVVVGVIG